MIEPHEHHRKEGKDMPVTEEEKVASEATKLRVVAKLNEWGGDTSENRRRLVLRACEIIDTRADLERFGGPNGKSAPVDVGLEGLRGVLEIPGRSFSEKNITRWNFVLDQLDRDESAESNGGGSEADVVQLRERVELAESVVSDVERERDEARTRAEELAEEVRKLTEASEALSKRALENESEVRQWLAWSGDRYPDDSTGDVVSADPDGTIEFDDGVTTWNPLRAAAWLAEIESRMDAALEAELGSRPEADGAAAELIERLEEAGRVQLALRARAEMAESRIGSELFAEEQKRRAFYFRTLLAKLPHQASDVDAGALAVLARLDELTGIEVDERERGLGRRRS